MILKYLYICPIPMHKITNAISIGGNHFVISKVIISIRKKSNRGIGVRFHGRGAVWSGPEKSS